MAKLLLCTPDVLLQFPFAEGLGIAAESMEHHLAPEKKGELLVELQRHAVGIANDHRNVILEIETAIRRYTANGENKHLRFNGAYPAGISFLLALEKLGANTTDVRVLETVRAAESSY